MSWLRRRMMANVGGGELYDAQVEYLRSDGLQQIYTGIYGNLDTRIEVITRLSGLNGAVAGSRSTNSNSINIYAGKGAISRFGNKGIMFSWSVNVSHTIVMDKSSLTYDGTNYIVNATTPFTTSTGIYLFGNENGVFGCDIMRFRMWANDTLLIDFIPVRKGQVGYMFDRVSGELFGNIGTGSFIVGPDI